MGPPGDASKPVEVARRIGPSVHAKATVSRRELPPRFILPLTGYYLFKICRFH
jgi:hypothetical protein